MDGMDGMDGMGGMGGEMQSAILGGAGDIDYPHYLINGKTPDAPVTLSGKPGARVRIRIINAGSDTAFRVALGEHEMTVTHSDGFPVAPVKTDAVMVAMGERYDVIWPAREPGKWLLHCHINHHTTNDNVEEQGGGLMLILDVAA